MKNIIYRVKENRYIGRKMINGHRINVYAKTQAECITKLKNKINNLKKQVVLKTESKQFLFKNLFMQWYELEKAPFLSKGAKEDILQVFKHLQPFHEKSIKKITKQELLQYFTKLEDGRKKEKIRLYLNACLKYYLNEGILNINPCANIKVIKSHNRKNAFTFEQQQQIMEALTGKPLKIIILIYLITGLRRREFDFKNIEKNIDFDNQILKAVNLKGRNLVKRFKYIKLTQKAISLIMNNIDIIHSYTDETVYREFSEVLKKLKINGSIVNCRHTFATNCFYLNKPELVISREMGHSTSLITKDIYTDIDYHLSAEKVQNLYPGLYNKI